MRYPRKKKKALKKKYGDGWRLVVVGRLMAYACTGTTKAMEELNRTFQKLNVSDYIETWIDGKGIDRDNVTSTDMRDMNEDFLNGIGV